MTQRPQQDCQELIIQGLTGFLSADGGEPRAGTLRCGRTLGGEMQSACREIRASAPWDPGSEPPFPFRPSGWFGEDLPGEEVGGWAQCWIL